MKTSLNMSNNVSQMRDELIACATNLNLLWLESQKFCVKYAREYRENPQATLLCLTSVHRLLNRKVVFDHADMEAKGYKLVEGVSPYWDVSIFDHAKVQTCADYSDVYARCILLLFLEYWRVPVSASVIFAGCTNEAWTIYQPMLNASNKFLYTCAIGEVTFEAEAEANDLARDLANLTLVHRYFTRDDLLPLNREITVKYLFRYIASQILKGSEFSQTEYLDYLQQLSTATVNSDITFIMTSIGGGVLPFTPTGE